MPPRTRPPTDHRASCARLIDEAEAAIDDLDAFTRLVARIPSRGRRGLAQPRAGRAVHLAAARVVAGAQRDADAQGRAPHPRVHQELADLIEMRDAAGARALMDDHVKMIRARRVAEHGDTRRSDRCSLTLRSEGRTGTESAETCQKEETHGKVRHRAAFPPAGMGRRGEGLLQGRRARLRSSAKMVQSTDGKIHDQGDKVGAYQSFEEGRKSDVSCACHWTVNVAASNGHGKLYADVYSVAPGRHLRARRFAGEERRRISPACRSRSATSRAATTRPSRRSSSIMPADKINLSFADGMLFSAHGAADRRQGAGVRAVQRAVLLRRAARLPQDHRHHLHDRHHDHRRSRPGGPAQVLPRAASARSATSTCGRSSTRTTTRTNSRRASTRRWTRAAGARASGWCSSPTPRKCSTRSFEWIAEHGIFADGGMPAGRYEHAIVNVAAA